MADKKFDPDSLQQGLGALLGRAAEAISTAREELLKQSRIGKVKLIDLTQLRRERARLMQRLGEECYRGIQAGSLDRQDLERTYRKVVAMDEQIAAKEAEVETIRREQEGGAAAKSGSKKKAPPPPPSKTKKKHVEEEEDELDDGEE